MKIPALIVGVAAALWTPGAAAESLEDVLAVAYQSNPTIRAERARLRALEETKAQAWAAALPQVTGTSSFQKIESRQQQNFGGGPVSNDSDLDSLTAGINGELPVFTGFRNFNAIKQAAARIRAGGAQLVLTEQRVLAQVAAAYFNVQRNMAVYELNNKNVTVLQRQLEMATARFDVGEITRTDVAQAEARLANARAQLTNAQGNLAIARSQFAQLVGHIPGSLDVVDELPSVPDTEETAQALGFEFSPLLVGARETSEASRRNISIARGALSPSVSIVAGYQYAEEPNSFIDEDEQFAYGLRASVPIFQGGLNYSRIREAKARHDADRASIIEAERQVQANITTAWERLIAARAVIKSAEIAVSANTLALEGVTQEALVGSRTTLDVLDAERELLNSEVSLVTAKRDEQSASFELLAAVGILTPEAIGISEGAEGVSRLQIY